MSFLRKLNNRSFKSYFYGVLFVVAFSLSLFYGVSIWFMGVYSLLLALTQFSSYYYFIRNLAKYDVLAARNREYAKAYPFLELFAGLFFISAGVLVYLNSFEAISSLLIGLGSILALIFSTTTFFGVWNVVKNYKKVSCSCLGKYLDTPVNFVTLLETFLMIVMACLHLFGFI